MSNPELQRVYEDTHNPRVLEEIIRQQQIEEVIKRIGESGIQQVYFVEEYDGN